MRSTNARIVLICLVLVLGLAALPGSSFGLGGSPAPDGTATSHAAHKAKKHRCRVVRRHGRVVKRVCRHRRHRPPPPPETPPITPPGPTGPTAPPTVPPGPTGPTGPTDPPSDYELVDLITNNGFEDNTEHPTSCFAPFGSNDGTVSSTATDPIEGLYSLHASVSEYGRIGCTHDYGYESGPRARKVTVEGKLRVDSPLSGGNGLEACVIVYYDNDQNNYTSCQTLHAADGTVDVHRVYETDETKRLDNVTFQLNGVGTAIQATLDEAHLFVERLKGSEGNDDGGGGGGGGGESQACREAKANGTEPPPHGPPAPTSPCNANETPAPTSAYTPSPLSLATQRPYISLADYLQVPADNRIYEKFRDWVNQAVFDHNPGYLYSSTDAVIMYARTGDTRYIDDAIARVDADVRAAEEEIARGEAPSIAEDLYLHVGGAIEELALTYDYGFDRLTQAQKDRWQAYGDQAVSNLWSPFTATWGNAPAGAYPWSAWAINDPGDNYHFSFIKATELWALATRDQAWFDFLQTYKFPLIAGYYAQLTGGGSREGTGYGASQRDLWEDARMWKASTGEVLAAVEKHARESLEYWVNATAPTRDFYAPIGDLSRQSLPELFDYHENLVREALMATPPASPEARHGMWWLRENSVPETLTQGFTLRGALLYPTAAPEEPTALTYSAPGVGQFFTRSSWSTGGTWLQLTAGPYDQSHAHQDQGGFTFYRGTWLAVTSNIWSHSGLQGNGNNGDLATGASNVLLFTRPGPAGSQQTIGQSLFSNSTMEILPSGLIHANLSPAYSGNSTEVHSWTRDLEFQANELYVHDVCSVASDVTTTFQLHVPVQPVNEGGGTIKAGNLEVHVDPSMGVGFEEMHALDPDFGSGWRIDISNPAACEFDVALKALP